MSSAFVVSTLVGVTVATALGLVAATLARKRRAASRHVLLMAALGVSLFLPVFAAVMPPVRIAVPIARTVEPVGSAPADVGASEMNVASTIPSPKGRRKDRRDSPGRDVHCRSWIVACRRAPGCRASVGWPPPDAMAAPDGAAVASRTVDRRRSRAGREHSAARRRAAARGRRRSRHLRRPSRRDPSASRRRIVVQGGPRPGARARTGTRAASRLVDAVCRAGPVRLLLVPSARVDHPRQIALEAERACDDAVLTMAEGVSERRKPPRTNVDQLVGLAKRLSAAAHQPLLAMADWRDLSTPACARCSMPTSRAGAPARCCLPLSPPRR